MLFVANSVVIGNGDYTDEARNCTADYWERSYWDLNYWDRGASRNELAA